MLPNENKHFASPVDPDFYLQTLIHLVNRNPGINVPITLTVNGIVVSGYMIGGKEYFDTFSKDFADAFEGDAAQKDKLRAMLAAPGESFKPSAEGDERPRYLHLRDARLLDGGTPVTTKSVWRVRADSVDAMTLGLVTA